MKERIIGLMVMLVGLGMAALIGCGGGKAPIKSTQQSMSAFDMSAGYGTVALSVQWPKGKGRVIPEATERIVARLKRGGMTLFEKVIERGQTQVVFEKVPVGEWVLEAEAQGRFGEVLARGSASFTLEANQNKQVEVELTTVAPVVVTGSGPTQVTGTRVAQGTQVQPGAQPNTFNIQGVGTVLSPVNLDANNDGQLDTDVLVISAGSAPLGFPGFTTTDNAVLVVRIRGRQLPSVTVPINALGALQQNVALPPGDYKVTVENVTISSGGNQLLVEEMTYAFSVFRDGDTLRHTLPTEVSYRLPVVGQPIENVFLELTVDPAARTANATGSLIVLHANGSLELTVPVGTDGKVTFRAQPGGPNLGEVSFVSVGVLLPPPPSR